MAIEINSFPCPKCGGRLEVRDSRPAHFRGDPSIRRRRRCRKCGDRLTTFEVVNDGEEDFRNSRLPKIISAARDAHDALSAMIAIFDAKPSDDDSGLQTPTNGGTK